MLPNFLKNFKFWGDTDDRDYELQQQMNLVSVASPKLNDGAIEVEVNQDTAKYNALHQQFFGNHEPTAKSTKDLINMYRMLVQGHEVDNAVNEIVNDAIVQEDNKDVVSLNLDSTGFSENIKTKIIEEFNTVQGLLDFNRKSNILFKDWYVDSRIFFHKIYGNDPKKGIAELRQLDPRNIEFIREVHTEDVAGVKLVKGYKEYFIYENSETYTYGGKAYDPSSKIKIPRAAIAYAHSGLTDCSGNLAKTIGYLHRAIKPANQLKLLEDAMVIYRITRAPERRVFYVDVGNMPAKKASQYVNGIMQSLKNRVVYDSTTGTVKNQKHNLSMTEDYWLMRRDGKSATEVTSLPGAASMGEMDDVRWFNKKLYEALRVPLSRLPQEGGSTIIGGAGTEITRDELNFAKLIRHLRHLFEEILIDPLRSNLIMKKIITEKEWDNEKDNIRIAFQNDSYFSELKDTDILQRRVEIMNTMVPFVGKYVSHNYIMKEILKMSDEQIKEQEKLIESEVKVERFQQQEEEF